MVMNLGLLRFAVKSRMPSLFSRDLDYSQSGRWGMFAKVDAPSSTNTE